MIIEKDQEIQFENLLVFQDAVSLHEVEKNIEKIVFFANENGLEPNGPLITAVHQNTQEAEAQDRLNIEIMLPVKRVHLLTSNLSYVIKEKFKLTNALKVTVKEDVNLLDHAYELLEQHIIDHSLEQITDYYTVNRGAETGSGTVYVECFVGISPNIL